MNQTLSDLRARLGAPARFVIDAEPDRRKRVVVTAVHWSCGCSADGASFTTLTLEPCADHNPVVAPARRGLPMPVLRSLLSRP